MNACKQFRTAHDIRVDLVNILIFHDIYNTNLIRKTITEVVIFLWEPEQQINVHLVGGQHTFPPRNQGMRDIQKVHIKLLLRL